MQNTDKKKREQNMQRTDQYMQMTNLTLQNNVASIKNLKTQIEQLGNILIECYARKLPSNTIPNSKEQVQALTLRSGKEVRLPTRMETKQSNKAENDKVVQVEETKPMKEIGMHKVETHHIEPCIPYPPNLWPNFYMEKVSEEAKSMKEKKEHAEPSKRSLRIKKSSREFDSKPCPSKYAHVPFAQRLKQNKLENQFSNFWNIFKQLHINIHLIEALEQMSTYIKFFRDILSNK